MDSAVYLDVGHGRLKSESAQGMEVIASIDSSNSHNVFFTVYTGEDDQQEPRGPASEFY